MRRTRPRPRSLRGRVTLVAVLVLMTEAPRHDSAGLLASLRATPRTIAAGTRLLRGSHALMALVALELMWGLGVGTYESLLPVRLAEITSGPETEMRPPSETTSREQVPAIRPPPP